MRLCIQCLYSTSWLEIAKVTVPNITAYARTHGFGWNIQSFPNWPSDYGFQKIIHILEQFDTNEYDFVMSVDCDCLFTNFKKNVRQYLDKDHDLFICEDYNGLNAGVFCIRNSEWSKGFLKYLLYTRGEEGVHGERDAINHYMREFPNSEKIKILPQQTMNAYLYDLYPSIPKTELVKDGEWCEFSSLLLHLPGIGMQKRLDILNNTPVLL